MKYPLLSIVTLSAIAAAAPTTTVDIVAQVTSKINSVFSQSQASATPTITAVLSSVTPTASPTSPADFVAKMQQVYERNSSNLYDYMANLRSLDLIDSFESFAAYPGGALTGEASSTNSNPDPPYKIYPKRFSCDAPYSMTEKLLRQVIYIPETFTYGKKRPVILYPGTGSNGYFSFSGNYIKLLRDVDYADPVWINDPKFMLDDIQNNSEYAAYAMNYIAAITGRRDVAVLSWSQGSLDVQWATKYWPSTRRTTTDHITLSPDFSGTTLANFITPPGLPMPPAVIQQRYLSSSQFITALRSNGGDSAYIPTTSIWSALFDEIVQPQASPSASGQINDARNIGVSNNQLQSVCPGQPAGSFYSHEGVMYNPIAFGLFKDAMTNPGPGQASRVDPSLCTQYLSPGLNIADALITENAIPIAGFFIITYPYRVVTEPQIRSYAYPPPNDCSS